MVKVGDPVNLDGVIKSIDGDKITIEVAMAQARSGGMPDDPPPAPSIPPGSTVIIIYR